MNEFCHGNGSAAVIQQIEMTSHARFTTQLQLSIPQLTTLTLVVSRCLLDLDVWLLIATLVLNRNFNTCVSWALFVHLVAAGRHH